VERREGGLALLILALFAAVQGALSQTARAADGEIPLAAWFEDQLAPSLVEDFARHPRFRGRPVQVVVVRGDREPAVVDGLARQLAERLASLLAASPGTRLVPAGAAGCIEQGSVEYRLAVEVTARARGRADVRVRVFDVHESNWTGGVGGSWSGDLTARERDLLRDAVVLETARGRRDLPFERGQSDLLAGALAAGLECTLLEARAGRSVVDGRRVHFEPAGELPAPLRQAALMVLHELSLAHGFERVYRLAGADLVLRPHAHRVDGAIGLYWITLERLGDGAGAGAGRADVNGGSVVARARAYVSAALLAGAGGTPADATDPPVASGSALPSGAAAPSAAEIPPAPRAADDPAAEHGTILTVPRLVSADAGEGCPETSARRVIGGSAAASPRQRYRTREAACAAVEFRVARDAEVYLVWQPGTCELAAAPGQAASPRLQWRRVDGPVTVRAPVPVTTAERDGYSSVYVIAVDARVDALPMRTLLEHHPGEMDCRPAEWRDSLQRWAEALAASLYVLGDRADWQALRVPLAALHERGGT
jgi:hypothetical protein